MDIHFLNIYVLGMFFTLMLMVCFPTAELVNNRKGLFNTTLKLNKFILTSFFICFWGFIAAFRNLSVGTDTLNYSNIFIRIINTEWIDLYHDVEFGKFPLYLIYNKIVGIFFHAPNAITFFNSAIFVIGVVLFLYYNSKNLGMSLFLFLSLHYYFFALNIARESLAVMLILWVFHFAIRNKKFVALFINVLAALIHFTAMIGLIVLFITLFCNKHNRALIIVVVFSIGIVFLRPLITLFVQIFPHYKDYVYGDGAFSILNNTSDGKRVYIAIFLLCIFILCFLFSDKAVPKKQIEGKDYVLLVLFVLSVLLMIIHRKNEVMARLELYFTYFFMISVPYFVSNKLARKYQTVTNLLIVMVLLIPFYTKLVNYLPYTMIF